VEIIGWIAAGLTTISFLPQAVKVLRSNETSSISLWMYSIFTIGILCWLIYGVYLKSSQMIISNLITFFFAVIILRAKVKNG
jgi:MtN3 and saliva related transmembrane protein|tara:strand:+ start:4259 stop:4504 length:246 start_codon:yes stop_codon:yes gene_type:complete